LTSIKAASIDRCTLKAVVEAASCRTSETGPETVDRTGPTATAVHVRRFRIKDCSEPGKQKCLYATKR
jgi:hypothetical protein